MKRFTQTLVENERERKKKKRKRYVNTLQPRLILCRGKKSGRTVRISDDKGLSKPQEKPFPTAEVIELRRLADEYKVIGWEQRCHHSILSFVDIHSSSFDTKLYIPFPPFLSVFHLSSVSRWAFVVHSVPFTVRFCVIVNIFNFARVAIV